MIERIEAFWQDATADDVARMMKGETVEARFRDHLQEDWSKTVWLLAGYDSTEENKWIDNTGCPWRFCQVYREPSWHAKKPDPGPGYRLLGKFPDEEPKPGDECQGVSVEWGPSCQAKAGGHQVFGVWYRRRIEPESPSPAKVRVDLALAAHSLRAAVLEYQRAEDTKDKLGKAMFEAFAAAGMLDAVVKIDGDHYHFFASEGTARFRKIEVL
jgi:hypothetical protein